jgi:hypothetical protein
MNPDNVSDEVVDKAEMSHADRVRQNVDTKDLSAIMSRFYRAVSWGDE